MNIIYIASLIPQKYLDEILIKNSSNYNVASQKFHRTLVKGFLGNGHQVIVLSYLQSEMNYITEYNEDGVQYYFSKFTNIPGIKHIQIVKGVINIIKKLLNNGFIPNVLICDVLNVSLCLGSLWLGKRLKIKTAGIVTDILGISSQEEKNIINRVASKISNTYISAFDYYILLTEQMNKIVNTNNRPNIVMEGVCEKVNIIPLANKDIKKLFYAGGRPSKDGVDILVAAFKRLRGNDIQLNIYGYVPNVEIGHDLEDSRIIYHGLVDNKIIMEEERGSYLLINPRPTGEEYTKFSFPSKVMEYMSSGVPMVTTRLSGIPEEYFNYVYTFDSCDEDSYHKTLMNILSLSERELKCTGLKAQEYVLTKKNNIYQTALIIELINKY